MLEYKGYTGVVEFDPDLGLFAGHVVDLRDEIYFEGDSVEALQASLQRAVDHYLEVCEARGEKAEKPFSGKLNLRLGPDVHRAAAVAAATEGESINAWIVSVVESAAMPRTLIAKGKKPRPSRKAVRKKPAAKRGPARAGRKTVAQKSPVTKRVAKKSPSAKATQGTQAS